MAGKVVLACKPVPQEWREGRVVRRESLQAIADIAWRQDSHLMTQPSRAPAVIGNRHDSSETIARLFRRYRINLKDRPESLKDDRQTSTTTDGHATQSIHAGARTRTRRGQHITLIRQVVLKHTNRVNASRKANAIRDLAISGSSRRRMRISPSSVRPRTIVHATFGKRENRREE
jgi:hypothetical protein